MDIFLLLFVLKLRLTRRRSCVDDNDDGEKGAGEMMVKSSSSVVSEVE